MNHRIPHRFIIVAILLKAGLALAAVDARIDQNIDGGWRFLRADATGAQAPDFDDSAWQSVNLPYTWVTEEKNGRADYYNGPAWYRHHFTIGPELAGKSLFLRFGAASRVAQVYLNGQSVGEHEGPYAAFCFDISSLAHPGDNVLAVRVDNSFQPNVAPLSGDFTVYGGLFREVHLLALNPISITPLDDGGPGVYLKNEVTDAQARVQVTTKLRNDSSRNAPLIVACTITDASGAAVGQSSTSQTVAAHSTADAVSTLAIEHPHLWNGRTDPYLYQAVIELKDGDAVLDRVSQPLGLRYFKVDPNEGFFLNGKSYDLHGVNYHEGRLSVGYADTPAMEEEDNHLICDMGCTAVRMAHYQHNDYEYTLCDRAGIVVWTELDLVNKMVDTPAFQKNIRQQLRELIKQNFNHPSVCFWSMYNEPWVGPKVGTQEQWHLIDDLVSLTHQLDPTRLTTGGVAPGVEGPIDWYMDVTGINRYSGWYVGPPDAWPATIAEVRSKYPGKSCGISEYGGGASAFQHESPVTKATPGSKWHPEEWEAVIHEHAWSAMEHQPWLWCKLVWCMFDFSSYGRNEGDRPGINDKGLVTADRKTCKDAYFFYKASWTKDPFVYITDRRFNPRPPGPAELKVYSNCESVELFVDGQSLGSKANTNCTFTWPDVQLPQGAVQVKAIGTTNGQPCDDSLAWTVAPKPEQGASQH
jgi:beta-galactosidase